MALTDPPCWPDPDMTLACCKGIDTEAPETAELVAKWAPVAASILFSLSGRRIGVCPVEVRPCGRDCEAVPTYAAPVPEVLRGALMNPHMVDGAWVNGPCGCVQPCGCCDVCEVALPGPVAEVTEIWLDGQLVDPATYRIDDHRKLVRMAGYPCWPRCQDLDAGPQDAGAFTVRYTKGLPLDFAGQWAYAKYVCELVKACTGDRTCELPKRVQSITREGVTATFVDDEGYLDKGRTGLIEVDAWLAAVNPYRMAEPSAIYSPDYMPPRTTTWSR